MYFKTAILRMRINYLIQYCMIVFSLKAICFVSLTVSKVPLVGWPSSLLPNWEAILHELLLSISSQWGHPLPLKWLASHCRFSSLLIGAPSTSSAVYKSVDCHQLGEVEPWVKTWVYILECWWIPSRRGCSQQTPSLSDSRKWWCNFFHSLHHQQSFVDNAWAAWLL